MPAAVRCAVHAVHAVHAAHHVANLDAVAEQAVAAAFWNMGENCSAGLRILVPSSRKAKLLEKVQAVLAGSFPDEMNRPVERAASRSLISCWSAGCYSPSRCR